MNTTMLIKLDKSLKEKAQKTAKEMGLPLSTVVHGYLKKFVAEKQITFESYIPNAETVRAIKQARKDYKAGNLESFETMEEFTKYLKA